MEIDIGKWRVILAICGEGRLSLGSSLCWMFWLFWTSAARVVARLNTCVASGSYSLFASDGRITQGALSAAVSGWAVWVCAAVGRRAHLCLGRRPLRDCCGPPTKETKPSKIKPIS